MHHDQSREKDFILKNLHAMIGDVNLFLSDIEDDDNDDDNDNSNHERKFPEGSKEGSKFVPKGKQSELDVMIAETDYHRKGMGREASLMMMSYGAKNIGIQRFFVKIKEENTPSLKLFKGMGFNECDYVACFKEYELELSECSPDLMAKSIKENFNHSMYEIGSLDHQ